MNELIDTLNQDAKTRLTSLQRMRPFVPNFIDANEKYDKGTFCTITLENLLYGKENGSYADIKLGVTTVTVDAIRRGTLIVAMRERTDQSRTTADYGFTLAGMCLKDASTGQVKDKKYKFHPQYDEAKQSIGDLFRQGDDELDVEGLEYVKGQLELMLEYFKELNEHYMRGMSLFIVVDSRTKQYVVKLIDFASFEQIPQDGEESKRDEGIVKGISSILTMIE